MVKLNNLSIEGLYTSFMVTTLDLDSEESSVRTANGSITRERIAVKRQIEIEFGPLSWQDISNVLQAIKDMFFSVYYPDPMTGKYETKTFYVGNRPANMAIKDSKGNIMWSGLKLTLVEQ